ncbi:hypothetical protein CTT39_06860 [Agrobacterium rosae]|nr:hypothetical protein CTT39_06860 [Agrobacterium rosae]
MGLLGGKALIPTPLIPVPRIKSEDFTGIQPRRVRAVNEPYSLGAESSAPKDLGALDSCDKHRNEGSLLGPPVFKKER